MVDCIVEIPIEVKVEIHNGLSMFRGSWWISCRSASSFCIAVGIASYDYIALYSS